ncbi:glucuronyltransferase I [Lycorma delicatula]|uniref:glucuronyltransferase I n=1 Tax=Lycorma delicatula TaxID=130591 RepID=UPI003F51195A
MYSTSNHKWSMTSQDMPLKKKLFLYSALVILVFLWFLGVRNRGDAERYEAMRQTLDTYEMQLKESKEQMAYTLRLFKKDCDMWYADLPVIYAITPTYARPVQKAELTRLAQTFMLVPNIHWIVVEDAEEKSRLVSNLLASCHLNYTHLSAMTPPDWKRKAKEPNWKKPRGVIQRNMALQWLRDNTVIGIDKGVIYFADDDNTYSIQIFNEMRHTKRVSVWPVGLVGGLMVERPIIDSTGHIIGWNSAWHPERPFPIDMAGFAINLQLFLKNPEAKFSYEAKGGYQESILLKSLITRDQVEPVADNCTKVYVWHTRTEAVDLVHEKKLRLKGKQSDDGIEV